MDKVYRTKVRKRKLAVLRVIQGITVALFALAALCGCGWGGGSESPQHPGMPSRGPVVTVTVPADLFGNEVSTWTANWTGGVSPYTIAWDFGGGAENIASVPGVSPAAVTATMGGAGGSTYTYTVTITDAQGMTNVGTGTYSIGQTRNAPPAMDVEVEGGTVTVTVFDADGDQMTVSVTDVPGMTVDSNSKVTDSAGVAVFHFEQAPPNAGFSGTTYITADDGNGGTISASATVFPDLPEATEFYAEYDRAFKILTLHMDFSQSESVRLLFNGHNWASVRGGSRQTIPGGWTTKSFIVELQDGDIQSGGLGIRAATYSQEWVPGMDYQEYETTVLIKRPLFISQIDYDYFNHEFSCEVDSVEDARLEFSTTIQNGITGTVLQQDTENLSRYTASVDYSAAQKLYGYVEVTVHDQYNNSDTGQVWLQHESAGIIDDRIYAFFDQGQAGVGEEVAVQVTTGELSHPFRYLLNAGLVLDKDAEYVANSFNIGSPGGSKDFSDGIWALVNPPGYILGPDMLIQPGANPEDTLGEKNRFDFNISPLGGIDVSGAKGDLFNIKVKYSEPGLKTLTFQQFNGVNRTYYSDLEESRNTFWDDCSNWHPGLQTSIVVE